MTEQFSKIIGKVWISYPFYVPITTRLLVDRDMSKNTPLSKIYDYLLFFVSVRYASLNKPFNNDARETTNDFRDTIISTNFL